MKNLKILFTSIILIVISVVVIQSCTSDNNESTESNQVNIEIEKSSQINQDSQFENLSTITKEEYLSMSNERKTDFYEAYISAFRRGGECSCSDASGCECSVICPSGTKPKCQCSENRCDCGCEPYSRGGIKQLYSIQKNKDNSVTLVKKSSTKSLNKFADSNLPNAKKISTLFSIEPEFKKEKSGKIFLSEKEFYVLESKFQSLMENYTIEQYFEVEYGF